MELVAEGSSKHRASPAVICDVLHGSGFTVIYSCHAPTQPVIQIRFKDFQPGGHSHPYSISCQTHCGCSLTHVLLVKQHASSDLLLRTVCS